MKKIVIIISLLLAAIVTMAYLYFKKLNAAHHTTDNGLYAATSSSALLFSFQNEKGITDILKEQPFFSEILGPQKYHQLSAVKNQLLSLPEISHETENQYIYIAFVPGKDREIDYMCFTQMETPSSVPTLLHSIKRSGIQIKTTDKISKLTLTDSIVCYLTIKDNLIVLSNSEKQISTFTARKNEPQGNKFADYIRTGSKFNKNSLAQLYINFNTLPQLLKNVRSLPLDQTQPPLTNQDAFASLTYNYSKEKVLFTGNTSINDSDNYYHLFSEERAKKITISQLLPASTSSYTTFAIDDYQLWRKKLATWQRSRKKQVQATETINNINAKYHLNLDDIFPKYFKDQMVTFQLSSSEKLSAINLTNGDKMTQLLIDLSDEHMEGIKSLKEAGILYAYFGQAFADFDKPYYVILDNYMVFANNIATLTGFLNSYNDNLLLINSPNYINASNQLPANSSISFYIDHFNSTEILKKNIFTDYYNHIQSISGLKKYDSFSYQLSADQGNFQTNILINKQPEFLQKDSLDL